jgi:hypothetical protein
VWRIWNPARFQQVDVQWSQLLMYIRLPDAARYFVAECFGQVSISAIVDGKRKDLISLNK